MPNRTPIALVLLFCGPVFAGYVEDRETAVNLVQDRKYEEAMAAFRQMAGGEVTEFQKSDALEQAAHCARRLEKFDLAMELADRIPLEAVAKTVRMQNLLAMRKPAELVEQFKDEDIGAWPWWKAGESSFARGRAFCEVGDGRAAEADLSQAVELTTDDLARAQVWLTLGRNREENLGDDDKALAAYSKVVAMEKHRGNSVYFRGLLSAAKILCKHAKHDEAEAVLRKVNAHELRGYWHGAMLCALGDLLAGAGRRDEALAAYQEVLADEQAHPSHRKAAREAIASLQAGAK